MLNGAYLLTNDATPLPGGGTYDCAGLFGPTCQTVNPEWRHNARANWDLHSDVTLSATWRYIGEVKLDNNDSNPLLQGSALGAPAVYRATMSAVSYLDLAGAGRSRKPAAARRTQQRVRQGSAAGAVRDRLRRRRRTTTSTTTAWDGRSSWR